MLIDVHFPSSNVYIFSKLSKFLGKLFKTVYFFRNRHRLKL